MRAPVTRSALAREPEGFPRTGKSLVAWPRLRPPIRPQTTSYGEHRRDMARHGDAAGVAAFALVDGQFLRRAWDSNPRQDHS
jgi:hypothetical protein